MKVPYNYLPQEFEDVSEIINGWEKLIKSSEYTLGPYIENWEKKFAKFVNAKYCISTNNGTDALILALKALNLNSTDEVITVANTFYATVGAIVAVGAKPVLIDADDKFQMNVDCIEEAITPNTKVIMPVHWGGSSPEMNEICKIAKKNKLTIVEDACMGIGGSINQKHPGTFGEIGAFSMHPLKSLNAIGDGGMLVTDNERLFNWMSKYRNHGMVDRDHIDFWGVNMRLQPLQSIVADIGLTKLNTTIAKRNKNASILDKGLSRLTDLVKVPKRTPGNIETFALYMATFYKRDELKKYLIINDIEVKIHYPIPLHKQKAALSTCSFNPEKLKNVEIQSQTLLTIPVHQFLNDNHMHFILKKIFEFYGKKY
jgi:dTDP-3-amino-2,3,6-trideoxy-4-keto-D-glucose/dTDP-3-amino-3,4,6-trideoxy-alpha-D-glucose/dTDP-2,6-dideoxy-D-kanosamine transaminase